MRTGSDKQHNIKKKLSKKLNVDTTTSTSGLSEITQQQAIHSDEKLPTTTN